MARVYGGLEEILGKPEIHLKIDDSPFDILNFQDYVLGYATTDIPFSDLKDSRVEELSQNEILDLQWKLLKKQLDFSYATTPAIKFLWDIYGLTPEKITSWNKFQKIPPITKEHQRVLGWPNFLPAPIADYYLNGISAESVEQVNTNLRIAQEKWTGGTSAELGKDYVQIIIPKADWVASSQTMGRILNPASDIVDKIGIAVTTYDMRHIARPIFEEQLRFYGKHLLARPVESSDEAWQWIISNIGADIGAAPPVDSPLKGVGWPGMLYTSGEQFKLALMSSTVPSEELLKKMLEYKITVLNVGGDTASLPTYCSLVMPGGHETLEDDLNKLKTLDIIQIGPAYTEVVSPVDLSPSRVGEEGVLLHTNYTSVWQEKGNSFLVPALKNQMIRSSATGNLVFVTEVNNLGRPASFYHNILRCNDFSLDERFKPLYGNLHTSGGSSRGGCAG
ncbi:hypothetical protein KY347_01590 [Candidatus Woesearchaeota archaeon]|nr:hypothetical protein [Candidatus Woesearchaeota archaeon]